MVNFHVLSPDAHAARARYQSDLLTAGPWTFISGLSPIDLADDKVLLADHIEGQTMKVLNNFLLLAAKVQLGKSNIVHVNVHLTKFEKFYDRMNKVYGGFFAGERLPVRTCLGVSHLARGALVEMDFVLNNDSIS